MAATLYRSRIERQASPGQSRAGRFQQTLAHPNRCSGIALHCGLPVEMTLRPAEVGTGIVFRRTDLTGEAALVAARWDAVADTRLCTTLCNGYGVRVSTVEHVMAALAACEIDNAIIDLDGPEPPAMDGSAAPFVALIHEAGIARQSAPRNAIKVCRPVAVGDRDRFACLLPADELSVECEIDFDSAAISRQHYRYVASEDMAREVAPARTFGLLRDVEKMQAAGLALGGSLDHAVVVDGDRILNRLGLRYHDEFARHKVLDAIGDLYLAGAPLVGRFRGYHSGHELNHAVLRALFADSSAWMWEYPCAAAVSGQIERARLL